MKLGVRKRGGGRPEDALRDKVADSGGYLELTLAQLLAELGAQDTRPSTLALTAQRMATAGLATDPPLELAPPDSGAPIRVSVGETVEQVKARAEQWVAQTRQEFREVRARLDTELAAVRAERAELEQAREAAQRHADEVERTVEQVRAEAEERVARYRQAEAEARAALEAERNQRVERRAERPDDTAAEGRGAESEAGGNRRIRAWAQVKALAAEGHSQREIARRLRLNRRTVARLIAADEPPRYRRRPRGSMLDPLEPVMRSALREEPRIDAPQMTELLRRHGYRGSVDLVRRRMQVLRLPKAE